MRLLVVSQYFWPENFRINELVSELVSRGHEVTVLTGLPNYPGGEVFQAYRDQPASFAEYQGACIHRVPLRPRGKGRLGLLLNYASFVIWGCLLGPWSLRRKKFDAVFVFQTSPVTAALPALLLGHLKGAPVALWILDLWPDTLDAVGVLKSKRALGLIGRLVSGIYERCHHIFVQSRAFLPSVHDRIRGHVPLSYLPSWVEAVFEKDVAQALPAIEVTPCPGAFNIMFAGNIGEAQDFISVLQAAALLKGRAEVRWLIVGDGRAAPLVRTEIERLGLADQVLLLGQHPLERMPEFFKTADVLLVPLKSDPVFSMTIPGKVQTCLATGLPVLGMLDGEGARVIEESGGGHAVAAGDAAGLAEQVMRLMSLSAEERQAMGALGRRYALSEFNRQALIDRLEVTLKTMIASV